MGVKHLDIIEAYLKKEKGLYTPVMLRNRLRINLGQVNECLEYLRKQKKIKKVVRNKKDHYGV